jgi:hypothetical protein
MKINKNMKNKYTCIHCKEVFEREDDRKKMDSYCSTTGKDSLLIRNDVGQEQRNQIIKKHLKDERRRTEKNFGRNT